MWREGSLLDCWWGCKFIQPLWGTIWRFLKTNKLGLKLSYDPGIPLHGISPEETIIEKDTCTPMFIAAILKIARTWKQARCQFTDKWVKKLWYIYTMKCYSDIKRNKCELVLVSWMNLESVIQSEVSQKERNK